jgi:hypothetical protein
VRGANFASVIELQNGCKAQLNLRSIHSVFLYSTVDAAATARVASQFCRATISIGKGSEDETEWRIAADAGAMFGAMRLRIHLASATLKVPIFS